MRHLRCWKKSYSRYSDQECAKSQEIHCMFTVHCARLAQLVVSWQVRTEFMRTKTRCVLSMCKTVLCSQSSILSPMKHCMAQHFCHECLKNVNIYALWGQNFGSNLLARPSHKLCQLALYTHRARVHQLVHQVLFDDSVINTHISNSNPRCRF